MTIETIQPADHASAGEAYGNPLADLPYARETFEYRGKQLTIYAVPTELLLVIIGQHAGVEALLSGAEVNIMSLLMQDLPVVLAAGLGYHASEDEPAKHAAYEKVVASARMLDPVAQREILKRIISLTFEGGIGPFLESLGQMLGDAGIDLRAASVATGQPTTLSDTSPS